MTVHSNNKNFPKKSTPDDDEGNKEKDDAVRGKKQQQQYDEYHATTSTYTPIGPTYKIPEKLLCKHLNSSHT